MPTFRFTKSAPILKTAYSSDNGTSSVAKTLRAPKGVRFLLDYSVDRHRRRLMLVWGIDVFHIAVSVLKRNHQPFYGPEGQGHDPHNDQRPNNNVQP